MYRHAKLLSVAAIAASIGLVACDEAVSTQKPAATASGTAAKLVKAEFVVEKMTCAACNQNVAVAAKTVDGVTSASASAEKKRAWVTFDANKTSVEAIAAAITKAGYPAKRAPAGDAAAKDGA